MAKSDLFQRSLEAGTAFVNMTRERAEAMVREWVDAGDLGKGKAKKAVDDVLDRSRRVTEELQGLVRREIGEQLAALGVATRADLARLEAKLDEVAATAAPPAPPAAPPAAAPAGSRASKGSPIGKAASTKPRRPAARTAKKAGPGPATGGGPGPAT
jgi:polyhydroxyalkanoate synthesis regulator phasin